MNFVILVSAITLRFHITVALDASSFTTEVKNLESKAVGAKEVQDYYHGLSYDTGQVNGPSLLKSISSSLELKFDELFNVADDIRKKVESSYTEFPSAIPAHMEECCKATGVKDSLKFLSKVKDDEACLSQADTSPASRKFPNGEVEKIMKEKYDSNPDLLWQHFGTEDGTSITFPKVKVDDNKCTSYDPRFRPFYAASATPEAKDVVVVIDKSGSMNDDLGSSTRLAVAKEAARTVISTLNPNDRIGILAFADKTETPPDIDKIDDECFRSTLSSATTTNKNSMTLFTNLIEAKHSGNSDFGKALKVAFSFFKNSAKAINGEVRDRVILFLTDSVTYAGENPLEVIRDENQELNNSVVVMTYAIDLDKEDDKDSLLENMSKQTLNGKQYGDVRATKPVFIKEAKFLRSKMGSYYGFFKSQSKKRIFTVPFVDTFSNIGLIISVCVSAYGKDGLIGVACADIKLADVFSVMDVFREEEDSYIFIIDTAGRTLKHPLLPLSRTIKKDHPLVDIRFLEREKGAEFVIESMKRQESGNRTFMSTRTMARGVVIKEGIETRTVESQYYWAPIQNTDYTLCVVVGKGDTSLVLSSNIEKPSGEFFVYHRTDLTTDDSTYKYCKNFNRLATKETSTVFLSSLCFKDPSRLLNREETQTDVQNLIRYFQGSSGNTVLKANVYASVVATYIAEKVWMKNSDVNSYLVWRYFGTNDGVVRVYPGIQLFRYYDHKLRPWYRRTLSQRGTFVVTTPYIDGWGAGYVVSLCKPIFKDRSEDKVVGVIASDIPVNYLYNILIRSYEDCKKSSKYSCMLIDVSGFIVVHPDFVSPLVTDRYMEDVHIVSKEGGIARDLIEKGVMQRATCADFDNYKLQHTYKLKLIQKYINGIVFGETSDLYELSPVTGTNLFMVIKKNQVDTNNCCKNLPMKSPDVSRCGSGNDICECLCYKPITVDICTNKVDMSDLGGTCSARTPDITLGSSPVENTKGVPVCFDTACSSRTTDFKCYSVAGCGWCVRNKKGDLFKENSCCSTKENCEFGTFAGEGNICTAQTTKPTDTTTETTNTSESSQGIVGIVGGTLGGVVFVLLFIIGVLLYRKGICRRNHHKPRDDYLTAIDAPMSKVPDVANPSFQFDSLERHNSSPDEEMHDMPETRYNAMPCSQQNT